MKGRSGLRSFLLLLFFVILIAGLLEKVVTRASDLMKSRTSVYKKGNLILLLDFLLCSMLSYLLECRSQDCTAKKFVE